MCKDCDDAAMADFLAWRSNTELELLWSCFFDREKLESLEKRVSSTLIQRYKLALMANELPNLNEDEKALRKRGWIFVCKAYKDRVGCSHMQARAVVQAFEESL